MKINQACKILKLPIYFSPRQLKKAYYKQAFATHPDVNKEDPTANEKFQQVAEAYQLLSKIKTKKKAENNENDEYHENDANHENKTEFLRNLIKNICGYEVNCKTLKHVISVIATKSMYAWKKILHNMDKETLSFLIQLISKHNDIFNISPTFVEELYRIGNERKKNTYYVLKPTLEHLLKAELFILKHDAKVFYIPLWEHELEYKTSNGTIYVKCCPNLPKHMSIDKNNTLHVNISLSKDKLIKNSISISIGKSILTLPTEKIKNKKYAYTFSGIGIPNTSNFESKCDIVDFKRSDIKVHVQVQ